MGTNLRERLAAGEILIADGATGTALMAAGLPPGTPPELWNVQKPDVIRKLYRSYLDAGSQIILTNTFGGTRVKLEKGGVGARVEEAKPGGRLTRPRGGRRERLCRRGHGPDRRDDGPPGRLTYQEAKEVFAQQALALAEGGVDLIWVETMMDLDEARAAVSGARRVTDLPIFCSLSFGPRGRTMMGVKAGTAAQALWPLGLTAIGANCGDGIDVIEPALRQMREVLPTAPLIAKPNAGMPRLVGDQTIYDMQPAAFAERIPEFVTLGAQIVGACCGSNPAHIAAVSAALRQAGA